MTDRYTADTINSDALDALYDQLAAVREQRTRYHQSLQQKTSHNHELAAALSRVRALHQPVGVVAAAEFGEAPDCPVCGPNRWPCPTYNALDVPSGPAATEATELVRQTDADPDDPPVQCWHTEADTPCDWDVCKQPERLAVGDYGTDPREQH